MATDTATPSLYTTYASIPIIILLMDCWEKTVNWLNSRRVYLQHQRYSRPISEVNRDYFRPKLGNVEVQLKLAYLLYKLNSKSYVTIVRPLGLTQSGRNVP